jgi:hypothetical protein
MMEPAKARPETAAVKSSGEYRRVEEEELELDEVEWGRRTEERSRGRRRAQRYVFTCALFASLNAILLGYGQSSSSLLPSFVSAPKTCRFSSRIRERRSPERRARAGS